MRQAPKIDAKLQLQTLFVLNERGRILSQREPGGNPGPLFC